MIEQRPPALRFEVHEDSRTLLAHFDPTGEPMALDGDSVAAAIAEAGFGAWHRLDGALERLRESALAAQAPLTLAIAERRDGRCEAVVAEDAMTAWLVVAPPAGGDPVGMDDARRALDEQGVVAGVSLVDIEQALAAAGGEAVVVARGRAAERGQPSRFESLIPEMRRRGPRLDERGVADYRELGTVLVVKAGDPLMRRIPATPGIDGEDVLGQRVPAEPGEDLPFAADLTGAAPSADDPDLLVASIAGQPVQVKHGVNVEPTISLPVVDLASGNVDFDGTVVIAGDVTPGMRVRATGDVVVGGMVEAAEIEAGGNIGIVAGAIGRSDHRVRLVAKGSVSVRFCENAAIEAGSDVLVAELALHSELTALQRILVGKLDSGKSQLIGGLARAGELLQVGTLGSAAAIRTRVQVGFHPQIHARIAQLRHELDAVETRIDNLRKVLALPDLPGHRGHGELRDKAARTLEAALAEKAVLAEELAGQEATLVLIDSAQVVVGKTLHPAVEMQLGGRGWSSFETLGRGILRLAEGEVVYTAG